MSAARRLACIAFTALTLSCGGGGSGRVQGEACVATSQCAQGLICDQVLKVCAMMGTPIDAPRPVDAEEDDAAIDARLIDARLVDAPVTPIDAPIDAAVIDAAVDAAVIDAAVDASP